MVLLRRSEMTEIQRKDLFEAAAEAHRRRDLAKAGQLYSQFVRLNPGVPEAWENLGVLLAEMGNLGEAENCLRGVLQHLPDWPMRHRLHGHLCWIYGLQGRQDAVDQGREAVRLAPEYESGWLNLGFALTLVGGHHEEAIASFERAAALGSERYHGGLYVAKRQACDWEGIEELERMVLDPSYAHKDLSPSLLVAVGAPQDQLALAQSFAKRDPQRYLKPPGVRHRVSSRKIRLGYLGGEFHDTSTMSLLAQTLENHDRDRFELHAFSFGPNRGAEVRQRLERAFDRFHEVSAAPNEIVARQIAQTGIDILVDLNGHLMPHRVGIAARRPAPIQVSFLGWPATSGTPFHDYIVADPFVAKDPSWFTEKPLYLDCYMPTDDSKAEPAKRERGEFDLPADAIVLGSMNSSWKLTPAMLGLWCEILREAPQTVLFQAAPNEEVGTRLRELMRREGLADRFIIAPKIDYEDHIDRIATLDLGLDSFPYGGHTTTCDILWAGVPVVTCDGGSFASAVATSLLDAVGLRELSTGSLAEYKALVLALCGDRARLAALKAHLNTARRSSGLFDNKRYTRGLEAKLIELVS
jgi:predicted O-linked N-acetylglucosamine transferase (SPINDLY family)